MKKRGKSTSAENANLPRIPLKTRGFLGRRHQAGGLLQYIGQTRNTLWWIHNTLGRIRDTFGTDPVGRQDIPLETFPDP